MKNVVILLNDSRGGGSRWIPAIVPILKACGGTSNCVSQLGWKRHLVNRTLPNTSGASENISKQSSYYGNHTVRNSMSRGAFEHSYTHEIEKTKSHVGS